MKKEKSLNFLSSRWLMIPLFVFGILLFGNIDASAQNAFADRITGMEQLRDTFAPGSAKYDITQEAVNYLVVLQNQAGTNPNWMNAYADSPNNPLTAAKLRKTHPSILANYSAAELSNFTQVLGESSVNGVNPNPPLAQKVQWILDANAY